MDNFKTEIDDIDTQRNKLREDQEKILLEQKKFNQKIANFLSGKIEHQIKTVYLNPFEYLTLSKDSETSFYQIFSHTGKIILNKICPNNGGSESKKKKDWKNFDEFCGDIKNICNIIGCKKTT